MNATATKPAADNATEDYKKLYEETTEAPASQLHNAGAKKVAAKVISTFNEVLIPKAELKLLADIKAAIARDDFDAAEALMAQRKDIKNNQAKDGNIIKEIRKHDFNLVLKAFRNEFDSIIYEIAYNVLTGTHTAIAEASKATRAPRASKQPDAEGGSTSSPPRKKSLFKVTKKDGTVVDFPIILGPKGNTDYKAVEEAYKALGFEVKKDGDEYVVEPGTIELKAGGDLMVNRINLMEAIEKQTSKQFDGWTVKKIKLD